MYLFKNNNNAPMKKAFALLPLIFTSLLVAGCSANGITGENETEAEETVDKSEQAIRAVIEEEFNGPDEKYKALWEAMAEAQISDKYSDDYEAFQESPEYQEFMDYMEETYASYFTENGYDNFINSMAFMYSGFDFEYDLNTSAIDITQSENGPTLYDFTFQVEYKDGKGESNQFNFEGKAIAPEEGQIGKIEYLDGFEDGLFQELRNREKK